MLTAQHLILLGGKMSVAMRHDFPKREISITGSATPGAKRSIHLARKPMERDRGRERERERESEGSEKT